MSVGTESLQHLAAVFSRRFFLNSLLPTFVFTTITATLVVSTAWSLGAASRWWNGLDVLSRLVAVLVYLAAVFLLAAAVASKWRGIVRLFEGYPLKSLARRFGRTPIGTRWHRRRLEALRSYESETADPFTAYYNYPRLEHTDDVLPTRLGNILLAGERYADDQYRIDPIFFWPRLYPLLPPAFQSSYEGFLISYEFPVVVSFQAMATAILGGGAVLVWHGPPVLFLSVFLGGCALAYAAYRFALENAKELAEQQRTAFDLYRDRLLEIWPTVPDVADEKEAFREIHDFVVFGNPHPRWHDAQTRHHNRRREERPARPAPEESYGPE